MLRILPEMSDGPVPATHRCIADYGKTGSPTDLASRIYLALSLDGISNVRYGDAQLRQLIGFYPEPHRILAGPKTSDRPTP